MINAAHPDYLQRHEQFLAQLLAERNIPAPSIQAALSYSLIPGGKRLRPMLVYLLGELVNVPLLCLDYIAAAIELTHCYSLVHDDLPAMDDDDFRRGQPSCHKAFDEATAILVGDGMQAFAIEILLAHLPAHLSAEQVIKLTHVLVKASGISGMVSGQSLDLQELANPRLEESRLRLIHQLKTGLLIQACADMVLAASQATEAEIKACRDYTQTLGLVFQMQDDYLDRYADPDSLGKGRSSDLANEKTTYASLYPQHELQALIQTLYQQAIVALQAFGERADKLLFLTKALQSRHSF